MDELRFFWNLVWNPGKYSKRQLDFWSAVKLYYTMAVLPFIAYVVIGSLRIAAGDGVHRFGASTLLAHLGPLFTSLSYLSLIWGGILLFFIALPLGIAIDAIIYQIIAKHFLKVWKGSYDRTFTALVFGLFPLLLLLWIGVIPIFNLLFIIVAPIWSLVVIVIALSEQQKITRLNALLVMLIKSLLVLLVFALIGISIFASLAYVLSNLVPVGSVGPLSNVTSGWMHMNWTGMAP
jgi:hypothetical protein